MAGSARMHVLGLPGNPVSAYVCAFLFLVPLIRRLAGRSDLEPPRESAVLGCDLPENDERADYLRATLDRRIRTAAWSRRPFPVQDSSMLAPLAEADCLVIREPFAPAAKAGDRCAILKLRAFSGLSTSSRQIKGLRNTYGTDSVRS